MSHPTVLFCAMRTAEAGLQSAERDNRFAASEREYTTLIFTSREAIAQSRQLLADLNGVRWPFFSARVPTR